MYDAWIKELKVGDEVAYGSNRARPTYLFSKVRSISPKAGVITLESGDRFSADGTERGSSYYRRHLKQVGEAKAMMERHQKAVKDRQKGCKLQDEIKSALDDLPLEKLEELSDFLKTLKD